MTDSTQWDDEADLVVIGAGMRGMTAALAPDHASQAFWIPASVLERRDGARSVFPHIFLDRAKPGLNTEAPFHAVAVCPADLATSTGLRTDAYARVMDAADDPIPGLYACGNDAASVMRGNYPGAGVLLGPALVFGYRAATHAAQRNDS